VNWQPKGLNFRTSVGPESGIQRGYSAVGDSRVDTRRESITSVSPGPKREFMSEGKNPKRGDTCVKVFVSSLVAENLRVVENA